MLDRNPTNNNTKKLSVSADFLICVQLWVCLIKVIVSREICLWLLGKSELFVSKVMVNNIY
jgi:hypothetical protein